MNKITGHMRTSWQFYTALLATIALTVVEWRTMSWLVAPASSQPGSIDLTPFTESILVLMALPVVLSLVVNFAILITASTRLKLYLLAGNWLVAGGMMFVLLEYCATGLCHG